MAANRPYRRRSRNDVQSGNRRQERSRNSEEQNSTLRHDAFDPSNYTTKDQRDSYVGSYSRRTSQSEYTQKRKKKSRNKTVMIVLAVVLVVVLGGAGAAFAYVNTISGNLSEGLDSDLQDVLVKTDLANEPFYMLLMGTDGSAERAESEEFGGDAFRSDSIILARIDPVDKKVTLISLHRDLSVDLGEYGVNKLNSAHFFGGASLTVETVSELAGVPISHYAEINFDGFKGVVDALGGIEVEVPMEIDDPDAGGYLAPGLQTLNGDQALILCRARHAYDEMGDGDSFRAANQRLVLSAIAKKILSSDVATMATTVSALSEYVTTDLGVTDIIGLAQAMQGLDTSTSMYTAMTPTTSQYIGGVWYEILNTTEWKKMMERVDQRLPPTEEDIIDEASGTVLATTGSGDAASGQSKSGGSVVVKNGSGLTGVATEAGNMLKKAGYTIETGNADSFEYAETLVIYDNASQADQAQEMVTTLGVGKVVQNDGSYSYTDDFLVIIGQDWY
ncbi:MAG: LCP family protein [Raoultibacter sp.]|jgi:LCP family protein required for cell wall assembly